MQERPPFNPWAGMIHWRRDTLLIPVFLGFSGGSAGKARACSVGDLGSIPGLGRSPGEGNGSPLQYSGLENSMDCIVHGVTMSRTRRSNFHFHNSAEGLPRWPSGKNLPANAGDDGDASSILGSGRSPGGGNGNPLQYPCLENPKERGAWGAYRP